jgi:hypothetical protein
LTRRPQRTCPSLPNSTSPPRARRSSISGMPKHSGSSWMGGVRIAPSSNPC